MVGTFLLKIPAVYLTHNALLLAIKACPKLFVRRLLDLSHSFCRSRYFVKFTWVSTDILHNNQILYTMDIQHTIAVHKGYLNCTWVYWVS